MARFLTQLLGLRKDDQPLTAPGPMTVLGAPSTAVTPTTVLGASNATSMRRKLKPGTAGKVKAQRGTVLAGGGSY